MADGVADEVEIDEIKQRCTVEITDAIQYAENSPFPDPSTVEEGVYAP
jgi:TPP-dependent pyruvate/acetoin dehydrogenase alpha subunit